jgi:lipopolysaccharide export LptBFGC system permease protein LptF
MSLTALFWLNFFAVAKWPLSQSRTPIAYVQRFAFPVVLVLLPLLGLWVFAHYTRGWSLGEILFAVLTTSAMTLWSPRTVERWRGFLGVPMLTGEVLR